MSAAITTPVVQRPAVDQAAVLREVSIALCTAQSMSVALGTLLERLVDVEGGTADVFPLTEAMGACIEKLDRAVNPASELLDKHFGTAIAAATRRALGPEQGGGHG